MTEQAILNVIQADEQAASRLWMEMTGDWPKELCAEDALTLDLFARSFAQARLSTTADLTRQLAEVREALRLFPEAHDVLTAQEMRDAKGNWRSLIDQQNNALVAIRSLTNKEAPHD